MSRQNTPDMAGVVGKAWIIPPAPLARPDHAASLDTYLLNVPGAHPFWQWWACSAIHLRPIEGVRPAHIRIPGATHEMLIVSIDPNWAPDWNKAQFGFEDGMPFLDPIDVMQQFIVRDDADARQLVGLCVRSIVDGRLSPDQDCRRVWASVVEATAHHIREGKHPLS